MFCAALGVGLTGLGEVQAGGPSKAEGWGPGETRPPPRPLGTMNLCAWNLPQQGPYMGSRMLCQTPSATQGTCLLGLHPCLLPWAPGLSFQAE